MFKDFIYLHLASQFIACFFVMLDFFSYSLNFIDFIELIFTSIIQRFIIIIAYSLRVFHISVS